jgi:hypothetical protein
MNKNKIIPQENIESIITRSLRKCAINAGKVEPSKFHPHTCHLCGWPNIIHTCTYCKKSVCIKCKIPNYEYCNKCVTNIPHLKHIIEANASIENKNCCSIM